MIECVQVTTSVIRITYRSFKKTLHNKLELLHLDNNRQREDVRELAVYQELVIYYVILCYTMLYSSYTSLKVNSLSKIDEPFDKWLNLVLLIW